MVKEHYVILQRIDYALGTIIEYYNPNAKNDDDCVYVANNECCCDVNRILASVKVQNSY